MDVKIYVTGIYQGLHRWIDAPDSEAFLRNFHRHIFNYKISIHVNHDAREIEFFKFKKFVQKVIDTNIDKNDAGSCEMQGRVLLKAVQKEYPGRGISVDISEDGENGALVIYYA